MCWDYVIVALVSQQPNANALPLQISCRTQVKIQSCETVLLRPQLRP